LNDLITLVGGQISEKGNENVITVDKNLNLQNESPDNRSLGSLFNSIDTGKF
jgi:hypothetical protein